MLPEEPAQPPGPPGPPDGLDDPMLDALERSIENPPAMRDPLAEGQQSPVDGLDEMLDRLEASIEDSRPTSPETPPAPDADVAEAAAGDAGAAPYETPSAQGEPEAGADEIAGLPETRGSLAGHSAGSPPGPVPPVSPKALGSRASGRPGAALPRPAGRRSIGTRTGSRPTTRRLCPDTLEPIEEKDCESCEKYRHWPEGTDEEPRQCWYDWQGRIREEDDADAYDGDEA